MSGQSRDVPKPDTIETPEAEAPPEALDTETLSETPWDPAERAAALETEAAELRDRLLRSVAEMDNLRKRTQREKEDAGRYAIARFARDLVSVADDLERALQTVTAEARTAGGDQFANLVAGVEMTERRLQQVFAAHGLKRFDPTGEKFDPAVHEAMFEFPDPSVPAGMVANVVEAGYMIGERVLRPARVGVSSGGPAAAAEAEAAAPSVAKAAREDGEPGELSAGLEESAEPQPEADPPKIGLKIDRSA